MKGKDICKYNTWNEYENLWGYSVILTTADFGQETWLSWRQNDYLGVRIGD